jgi:hypothetical protein
MWRRWEQDGFHVLGCRSLEPRVQLITADTAVFTHRVRTALAGTEQELSERETIVLRCDTAGSWRAAVHFLMVTLAATVVISASIAARHPGRDFGILNSSLLAIGGGGLAYALFPAIH